MTRHHPEHPRRGPHRDCPRRDPSPATDPTLPILGELEALVRRAAASRPAPVDGPGPNVGDGTVHGPGPSVGGRTVSVDPHGPDAGTTTVPSRSVRLSGTPASRTADAVDGAGWP